MRRLTCFLSRELLMLPYYGCFYSYLSYPVPIWGHECPLTQHTVQLQKNYIFRMSKYYFCKSVFRFIFIFLHSLIFTFFSPVQKYSLWSHHVQWHHSYSLRAKYQSSSSTQHNFVYKPNLTICTHLFNTRPTRNKLINYTHSLPPPPN